MMAIIKHIIIQLYIKSITIDYNLIFFTGVEKLKKFLEMQVLVHI